MPRRSTPTPPSTLVLLVRHGQTSTTGQVLPGRAKGLHLADAGIGRSDLYLAWDFTVASRQNVTERMLFMRDDGFARLGANAPNFTVTEVVDEFSTRIFRRITGTYEVERYVAYDTPDTNVAPAHFDLSGTRVLMIWRPGLDDMKNLTEVLGRVAQWRQRFKAAGASWVCELPVPGLTPDDIVSCAWGGADRGR